MTGVSIYGPPAPPPRDHAKRASVRLTRLVLGIIVLGALTYCGVLALLAFQRQDNVHLVVDQAETIRLDAERRHEALRLQTADLLPPIPARPNIEIPPPPQLQTAESLPMPARAPALQTAESLPAMPARESEREPPRPTELERGEPGRLQTAEILR